MEGLSETGKSRMQDRGFTDRALNRQHSKYEADAVTTRQRLSIITKLLVSVKDEGSMFVLCRFNIILSLCAYHPNYLIDLSSQTKI